MIRDYSAHMRFGTAENFARAIKSAGGDNGEGTFTLSPRT